LAALAAAAPAPDTTGMAIEDRTVPADPAVPVRIYRPHLAWPDRRPVASEPGPDGSSRWRRSIDTACRGHTSQPRRSPIEDPTPTPAEPEPQREPQPVP